MYILIYELTISNLIKYLDKVRSTPRLISSVGYLSLKNS